MSTYMKGDASTSQMVAGLGMSPSGASESSSTSLRGEVRDGNSILVLTRSEAIQVAREYSRRRRIPIYMKAAALLPRGLLVVAFQSKWRYSWIKPVIDWGASAFRNREGVIQRGVGKGLRFDPGGAHASYLLGMNEPDLQDALKEILRPGMTFFDVGSTVGFQCLLAARLVGPSGRVVAFEPVPDNARRVVHNASLNHFDHVTVRVEALGGSDSEAASFRLSVIPTAGRLANLNTMPQFPAGTMDVRLRKLDTIMRDPDMPIPDVIKIDVEGSEADVLSGAMATINRYRPTLMVELHATNKSVAAAVDRLDGYSAIVLEGGGDLLTAHWNAYVVAVPSENTELKATVEGLARNAALKPRRV